VGNVLKDVMLQNFINRYSGQPCGVTSSKRSFCDLNSEAAPSASNKPNLFFVHMIFQ